MSFSVKSATAFGVLHAKADMVIRRKKKDLFKNIFIFYMMGKYTTFFKVNRASVYPTTNVKICKKA